MRIARFRHLLETRGPDLSKWPAPWAEAGRRLVAADAAAARELEATNRLEALIIRHMARAQEDPGRSDAFVSRLPRRLPPQRSPGLSAWMPVELLRLDFSPAWPRVAALAAVLGLGFIFGLSDLGQIGTRGTLVSADTDLSLIVFEADPLSGMRPL